MGRKINFGTLFLFSMPVGDPQQVWDEDVSAMRPDQPKIKITVENWHEYKMQFLEYRLSEWAKIEKYRAFDRKRLIGFEIKHIEKIVPINTYESGMIEMYLELLSTERAAISENAPKHSKGIKTKPTAIALGLFCNLINASGIDKKGFEENIESYCRRICEQHNLKYRDRIRQNFYSSDRKRYRAELIEKVLPLVDIKTRGIIESHLQSKN